jgi:hypothetical protein
MSFSMPHPTTKGGAWEQSFKNLDLAAEEQRDFEGAVAKSLDTESFNDFVQTRRKEVADRKAAATRSESHLHEQKHEKEQKHHDWQPGDAEVARINASCDAADKREASDIASAIALNKADANRKAFADRKAAEVLRKAAAARIFEEDERIREDAKEAADTATAIALVNALY